MDKGSILVFLILNGHLSCFLHDLGGIVTHSMGLIHTTWIGALMVLAAVLEQAGAYFLKKKTIM
jgi:hypothetical protein